MTRAVETVLGQCLVRAFIAQGVTDPAQASVWLAAKLTPKASRVASFIVFWTRTVEVAGGPIGIERYVEEGWTSRAKAYNDQREFRELWTEYETPNEIAELLLAAVARGKASKVSPDAVLAL